MLAYVLVCCASESEAVLDNGKEQQVPTFPCCIATHNQISMRPQWLDIKCLSVASARQVIAGDEDEGAAGSASCISRSNRRNARSSASNLINNRRSKHSRR